MHARVPMHVQANVQAQVHVGAHTDDQAKAQGAVHVGAHADDQADTQPRKPSPSWAARVSYAALIGAAIAAPMFRRDSASSADGGASKASPLSLLVSERVERSHTPNEPGSTVTIDPKKLIDAIVARATHSWSDDERAALTRLFDTLDQLAGADRRFNHGDQAAITSAVLEGKSSVERVIAKRLVERKLTKALDELGVDPSTAAHTDDGPRALTLAQLRGMPDDIEIVKEAIARSRPESGDAIRERLQALLPFRFGESPLRNGVPSPKSPEALLDTVIDALRGLRM